MVTVEKLIEVLSGFPAELPVFVDDSEWDEMPFWDTEIREVDCIDPLECKEIYKGNAVVIRSAF